MNKIATFTKHRCDSGREFLRRVGTTDEHFLEESWPFVGERDFWVLGSPCEPHVIEILYCPFCGQALPDPVDGLPLLRSIDVDAATPA